MEWGEGEKKKKGSRSCILQPRTNGIPDLRSRILLDKPDPYRTSAICHTAPEQTSFRSSINHLFLFFSSSLLFHSSSLVCVLGSSTRIDYFPRRETGASSSDGDLLPEAATLDPVAGSRQGRSLRPEWSERRALPSFTLRVQESGTVLDLFVSTSCTSRYDYEVGSDRPRVGMPRRIDALHLCASRLVVDSASIDIHPIPRNASPFVLFLSFFLSSIFLSSHDGRISFLYLILVSFDRYLRTIDSFDSFRVHSRLLMILR